MKKLQVLTLTILLLMSSRVFAQSPTWEWARSAGATNSNDLHISVAVDKYGNTYTVGYFVGTTMQLGHSSFTKSLTNNRLGYNDGYIAKYDIRGFLVWAQHLTGYFHDGANYVSVDDSGNAYVGGFFNDGGMPGDSMTLTSADGKDVSVYASDLADVFVAKYDPNGNVKWAKQYGQDNNETLFNLTNDKDGNVIITGWFASYTEFGAYQLYGNGGAQESYVVKINKNNGSVMWADMQSSRGNDIGSAVTSDSRGNVYVAGRFQDSLVIGNFKVQADSALLDIFLAKYSPNGQILGLTRFGGTLNDIPYNMRCSKSGRIYLGGSIARNAKFGNINLTSTGDFDGFITKIDTSLNVIWAKSFGAPTVFGTGVFPADVVRGVAINDSEQVYVSGYYMGTRLGFEKDTLVNNIQAGTSTYDVFLAQFDSSGKNLFARNAGGVRSDIGYDCASFGMQTVHIAGQYAIFTTTATGTATFGSVTITSVGAGDGFVARLVDCTAPTQPTFTVSGKTTYCQGDSSKVSTQFNKGSKYNWLMDDFPISFAYDSVYYVKTKGDYRVREITEAGCYSDSKFESFDVTSGPSVVISSSRKTDMCQGDSVTLSIPNVSGNKYEWRFNGNKITVNGDKSSLVVKTAGSYTVYSENAGGCGATSTATIVRVNPIPSAITLTTNKRARICQGDSVTITSNTTLQKLNYLWYRDFTTLTTETNSTLIAKLNAKYRVQVTDSFGCTYTTKDTQVFVTAPPTINISITGNKKFCFGDSAVLSATTGFNFSYKWYRNDTLIPNATANTYSAKTTGQFKVMVDNNEGCLVSALDTITAYPLPAKPKISALGNTLLSSVTATKYEWFLAGNSLGNDSIGYKATASGDYSVLVTNANGCKNLSDPYTHTLTSFEFAQLTSDITLYPNPVRDVLNFKIQSLKEDRLNLTLLDASGKVVYQNTLAVTVAESSHQLDVSNLKLSNGLYSLQVSDNKGATKSYRISIVR